MKTRQKIMRLAALLLCVSVTVACSGGGGGGGADAKDRWDEMDWDTGQWR